MGFREFSSVLDANREELQRVTGVDSHFLGKERRMTATEAFSNQRPQKLVVSIIKLLPGS